MLEHGALTPAGAAASITAHCAQSCVPEATARLRFFVSAEHSFDQIDAARLGAATAQTGDGRVLTLRLVGRSRSLQQQATLLQFAIESPAETLDIGLPVSVIAETGARTTGIVLPRASVTQAPNGQSVVFQHKEAELFVPRPVRLEALDAERVLILDGITPGERIVTRNAPLVNQVR